MRITWPEPVFTDQNPIIDVRSNYASGQAFSWGIYDVVYTAKDASNNTGICHFKVQNSPREQKKNLQNAPLLHRSPTRPSSVTLDSFLPPTPPDTTGARLGTATTASRSLCTAPTALTTHLLSRSSHSTCARAKVCAGVFSSQNAHTKRQVFGSRDRRRSPNSHCLSAHGESRPINALPVGSPTIISTRARVKTRRAT